MTTIYHYGSPLVSDRLLRRYNRFLVDVELEDGRRVTAHTPNTGRMKGCSLPGSQVYLSRSNNKARKLAYTLETIRVGRILVGVNTLVPNRLVHQAIVEGTIPELAGYTEIQREVKISDNSRIDLVLKPASGDAHCYLEIKNVTLAEEQKAFFPDAQTKRGRKHLLELQHLVQEGNRGVIFFLVQRADCRVFRPADSIDPEYGELLREVVASGVEALAYVARPLKRGIRLEGTLPVDLSF